MRRFFSVFLRTLLLLGGRRESRNPDSWKKFRAAECANADIPQFPAEAVRRIEASL